MHLYARTRFIPLQNRRVPLGVDVFSMHLDLDLFSLPLQHLTIYVQCDM